MDKFAIGGDCASMRACEKVVDGVVTCIPWDTIAWGAYLLKVGVVVAPSIVVGALVTKRNRKKGAALGAVGALAGVGLLAALKEKRIIKRVATSNTIGNVRQALKAGKCKRAWQILNNVSFRHTTATVDDLTLARLYNRAAACR